MHLAHFTTAFGDMHGDRLAVGRHGIIADRRDAGLPRFRIEQHAVVAGFAHDKLGNAVFRLLFAEEDKIARGLNVGVTHTGAHRMVEYHRELSTLG